MLATTWNISWAEHINNTKFSLTGLNRLSTVHRKGATSSWCGLRLSVSCLHADSPPIGRDTPGGSCQGGWDPVWLKHGEDILGKLILEGWLMGKSVKSCTCVIWSKALKNWLIGTIYLAAVEKNWIFFFFFQLFFLFPPSFYSYAFKYSLAWPLVRGCYVRGLWFTIIPFLLSAGSVL